MADIGKELKKFSSFLGTPEGQALVAFLVGSNKEAVGKWLVQFGKALGKEGLLSKGATGMVAKIGGKAAGIAAAIYIASEDIRKSFTKVKKAWDNPNYSVAEKVARTWVETWPPVMAVNDIRDFWNWLWSKPKKQQDAVKAISNADIDAKAREDYLKLVEKGNKIDIPYRLKDSKTANKILNVIAPIPTLIGNLVLGGPNERTYNNINKEFADIDAKLKDAEDDFARVNKMVERPKEGTTAETMWRREVERRMGGNDPKWYKGGKLNGIQYSGEYNFDMKNGDFNRSPIPTGVGAISAKTGLPSVGAMSLLLTIGKAENDLVENMFNDVTIKIKALNKNSAITTSWDKRDLLKLIHTMRVAYALWCIGKNCYKLVNEYQGSDLTLPYAFFAALGYDLDSWQSARAQIQEDLIFIAGKMDTYIDFTKLDLFKRTEQLFTSGYADSHSRKAQKILFTLHPQTTYYNFMTSAYVKLATGGGACDHTLTATTTGTLYSVWKKAVLDIIDSMINSQKVQDMLSCLRYVFGTGKANLFDIPSPSDRLKFIWNAEVMAQIENAKMYNISTYTMSDTQAGWINENLGGSKVGYGALTDFTKHYYNSHQGKVSKDDQLVASRLTLAYLTDTVAGGNSVYFGTEIATNFVIVATCDHMHGSAAVNNHIKSLELFEYADGKEYYFAPTANATAETVKVSLAAAEIALINSFDWAPIIANANITMGMNSTTAGTLSAIGTYNADWEDYAIMFDTSIQASLTWMSYLRNGNYSLYAHISTRIDEILDSAKTA